jgi:dCMP deaminase
LKVGCILVKENRIISQGYNGFISGHPPNSVILNDHEIATIHAEQNAIIDCAKRGVNCEGAIAYITHFPCINCLKFLVQAGIKEIFYIHDYKNDTKTIKKLDINIKINKL